MLYVLILASITLVLGLFQFYSAIRNRGSIFWGIVLVIIPLGLVLYTGKSVLHDHEVSSHPSASTSLVAKSKKQSLKDDKLEKIKKDSSKAASQSSQAKTFEKSLAKSFKSFGDLSYDADSKTYIVNPTGNNKKAFQQWLSNSSTMDKSSYNDFKKTFMGVSKKLKKQLGSGYKMQINQPDSEKAMLIVKDGKIIYDHFE